MKVTDIVKVTCIKSDMRQRNIAADYRNTSKALMQRIKEIKKQLSLSDDGSVDLKLRLNILNQMYRTTSEIGREAEHYYEKGWWRSEVYTFNTR